MFGRTKGEIVAAVIGVVFTAVVGGAIGMATGWLQIREPALQFVRNEATPMKNNNMNTIVYTYYVYNVGNKEAENVDCVLTIPGAKVASHGVKPAVIDHTYVERGDESVVRLPLLNPGESITVQTIATSSNEMPAMPKLGVRGKGVVGVEKEAPEPIKPWSWWPIVFALATTVIATWMSMREHRNNLAELVRAKGDLTNLEETLKSLTEKDGGLTEKLRILTEKLKSLEEKGESLEEKVKNTTDTRPTTERN